MMIFPDEVVNLLRQANAIHSDDTPFIIVDNAQIHIHSATDMMGQTVPPLRPYTKASGIAKRKRSIQQKLMDRWTAMDVHVQQPTTRSHHHQQRQSRISISSTKLTKESYPLSSPTPSSSSSSKDTLRNLIGGTMKNCCTSNNNQKITDSPPSVDLSPRLVRRIPSDDGMNDMEMMIKKSKEQQQQHLMESSEFDIMKRCIASPRRPTRQESRKSGYDNDNDLDDENTITITSPSCGTMAIVQDDCHSTTSALSPNSHHHHDKKLSPYTTMMSKKNDTTCQYNNSHHHHHCDSSPRKPARRMNTMSHNNLAHLSTIVLSSSPTPVDISLRAATKNLSNQLKENYKHDNSCNTTMNDNNNVTTVNTKAINSKSSSSSSPSRKTVLSLMEALTIVNLCDVLDNDNNNNHTLNHHHHANTNVNTKTANKMIHEQQHQSSNRSCSSSDESTVESIPSLNSNNSNSHHAKTSATNTSTNTTSALHTPVSSKSSIKSKSFPQAA